VRGDSEDATLAADVKQNVWSIQRISNRVRVLP